jgi:hypothetical protein
MNDLRALLFDLPVGYVGSEERVDGAEGVEEERPWEYSASSYLLANIRLPQ